jgi:succinate dehydrogenase flavin-adding protein (antitoxin of CptAB toxin-antitoxin module)
MYTIEEYKTYLLSDDYKTFLAGLKAESIDKYNKHLVEETFAYFVSLLEKDDEKLVEFMLSDLYEDFLIAKKAQIDKATTANEKQIASASYYAYLIGKLHAKFIAVASLIQLDEYLVSEFYADYLVALKISENPEYENYLITDINNRLYQLFEGNEAKFEAHLVTECYQDYLAMVKRTDLEKYKAHLTGDIYAYFLQILDREGYEDMKQANQESAIYADYLGYQG